MNTLSCQLPADVRTACRNGEWTDVTAGLCGPFAQANLAILPADWAFDFLRFCQANPKPCPVLEVTDPGDPVLHRVAPQADLRTDLPRYRVYRHGELVDEVLDLTTLWQDDLVGFLIGCSFSFEAELLTAGIPVRHIELGSNVPMYRTNIPCHPAGRFHGPVVVSMRPMLAHQAIQAVTVTSRLHAVHGAPIHLGDPSLIGISDLDKPDYGDPVPLYPGEIPVFWACGVTPQAAALASKPPLMITHAPGHMLITDIRNEELLKDW